VCVGRWFGKKVVDQKFHALHREVEGGIRDDQDVTTCDARDFMSARGKHRDDSSYLTSAAVGGGGGEMCAPATADCMSQQWRTT